MVIASEVTLAINVAKHYDEIRTDHKRRIAKAKATEKIAKKEGKPIPKKEQKAMNFRNHMTTAVEVIKVAAIPFTIGVVGLGLMFHGFGTVCTLYKNTSLALGAATAELAATKAALKANAPSEIVNKVLNGTELKEYTMTETNPDTGEELTTTRYGMIMGKQLISPHPKRIGVYTFVVDQSASKVWFTNPERIRSVLYGKRRELQYLFDQRGFLFLNEALDALGIDPVPDGGSIGWSRLMGSTEIDFGIDNWEEPMNYALCHNSGRYGYCFVVDFNCVGDIRNKMCNWQQPDPERMYEGVA